MPHCAQTWLRHAIPLTALTLLVALSGCNRDGTPTSRKRAASQARDASLTTRPGDLTIREIRVVASGVWRPDARVFRGERVAIHVTVAGLASDHRRVRLTPSLLLRDASRQVVLTTTPAPVDRRVPLGRATHLLLLSLGLHVPAYALPGRGSLQIQIRDQNARKQVTRSIPVVVVGPIAPRRRPLRLLRVSVPPPEDARPGLPLTLDFEVAGLHSAEPPSGRPLRHPVSLTGDAILETSTGKVAARSHATLLDATPSFRIYQARLRWPIPLPISLAPGRYRLHVTLRAKSGGGHVEKQIPMRLLPGGLGIYAARLSGADGSPRAIFGRGDTLLAQIFVAGWDPPATLDIGVGLLGPDHGIYFVRKRAHRLVLRAGDRRPRALRMPIRIPEFVPSGRWTLQLRILDAKRRSHATRSLGFRVVGAPLRPLPRLTARHLSLTHRGDSLPIPGIFVRAGSDLRLSFEVGGMRLTPESGYYHRIRLVCAVRLRDRRGAIVKRKERACAMNRRFPFQPMRLRLHARFEIPENALGLHQLEVEVQDLASNRVSMVLRRLFLLAPVRRSAIRHSRPMVPSGGMASP